MDLGSTFHPRSLRNLEHLIVALLTEKLSSSPISTVLELYIAFVQISHGTSNQILISIKSEALS